MAEVDAGVVTPVVPVAPAADAAPAPSVTATPEGDGEPKPDAPQRTKFDPEQQKEVDRIVAKRVAQESRRLERVARAEARAEFAERQLEERSRPAADQPKGKPQPKDYENAEAYLDARDQWNFEQREKARTQDDSAKREQREQGESVKAVMEAVSKGSEEFEDFEAVVFSDDLPMTQAMAYAIGESKAPAKVAYYLGTHPQEAARIARMSPTLQAHEIHTLVSKVTAAPAPTKTPAPIVPNGGNASGSKSMLDMSQEEFEKHREARLKKAARR